MDSICWIHLVWRQVVMIHYIKLLMTFIEFVIQIVEIFPSVFPGKIVKHCHSEHSFAIFLCIQYKNCLVLLIWNLWLLCTVCCCVEDCWSQKGSMDIRTVGISGLKEAVHFSGAVYLWSSQAGYSSIHHHSPNKTCTRGLQHVMWWHRQTDPQTSAYHHLTLVLPD